MASSLPSGYSNLVECPYNKAHQILAHRMQTHLIRCRKQHTGTDLFICNFNTTHRVPKQEAEYHTRNCPDRASFEMYLYGDGSAPVAKQPEEPKAKSSKDFIAVEEAWDDDAPTYDPKKYCENANVILSSKGLPKAQRKAFRAAERIRLGAKRDEEEGRRRPF